MPWESTTVTDERVRFVLAYQREVLTEQTSMAALCERFGITRKTGYKFVRRQREEGWQGLSDRSRAPLSGRHWIDHGVRDEILAVKERYDDFGAKKIAAHLRRADPDRSWPSVSAIHQTLKRAGLVDHSVRRRRYPHPGAPPPFDASVPNEEWSVDFKGQFRTRDRRYCFPLTIADTFSRYLLACESMLRPSLEQTWRVFERVFRAFGLPEAIRSDNGIPFAASSLRRLTRLSVRWIRLGIRLHLIEPGKPQQNARHERMHKTLKARVCVTPGLNARDQQKFFDGFRYLYNEERPHEALGQIPPAEIYVPSTRIYPSRLPELEYAAGFEQRRVNTNGVIKWNRREVFLTEALSGESVGLQLIDDGIWILMFGSITLGYYSDPEKQFYPEKGPA
jgi:putative transposase